MTIREVLCKEIAECGLSYTELAEKSGVRQNNITRFVQGKNDTGLRTVQSLADYFGLVLTKNDKAALRLKRKAKKTKN